MEAPGKGVGLTSEQPTVQRRRLRVRYCCVFVVETAPQGLIDRDRVPAPAGGIVRKHEPAMNLLVNGPSLRQWLESSGRVVRPALRDQMGRGSEHRRAAQTGDVILVAMGPVLVAVLRQQSLRTLRGDIEQQVRVVCSQGLVECCFEVLDIGGQTAVRAQRNNAVSQPEDTSRGAGLS